jgi:hypothetical protein
VALTRGGITRRAGQDRKQNQTGNHYSSAFSIESRSALLTSTPSLPSRPVHILPLSSNAITIGTAFIENLSHSGFSSSFTSALSFLYFDFAELKAGLNLLQNGYQSP